MRAWRWSGHVFALIALVATHVSIAHAEERVVPEARIESARGIALGTGARSTAASTQAQTDNPANLVVGGLYHIESFLGYDPTFKRIGWGATVVDSMTSALAAGLSVRGLFGDNSAGKNSGWEGRLSLAFPIGDFLSLGVAGRYAKLNVADPKAKPEHPATATMPADRRFRLDGFTMDASLALRLPVGLSLAALAYNLIDAHSALAPLLLGGSLGFATGGGFSIGGDVLVDMNQHKDFSGGPKLRVGGGLEYLAQGVIPLRAGYVYDDGRHQHGVSGGLGYVDSRFGLQVSVRQIIAGGDETTVMGAVQYFVQ